MITHMDIVGDMPNNREIATTIWVSLLILLALFKKAFRLSLFNLLKALFVKQIGFSIAGMLLYVCFMVLAFQKVGFWDESAIKDTVLWTYGVAFVMLFNANKTGDDDHYIRRTLIGNIKLVVVLEFILNMYSFSLLIEIVIVPVVTYLVLLKAYAEYKPVPKQVATFVSHGLSIFGTVLLVTTFYNVASNYHSFATWRNLRDFLLPPALTIALLPFTYSMALLIKYENIFNRINISNDDPDLASYAKRRILSTFHIKLARLTKWSREAGILRFSNRNEVVARIENPMAD
jgi:hypothetical protein